MRNNLWIGSGISGMGGIPMLGTGARGLTTLIREIFRNGEQGFAYDPNDLTTLYQDAAGTIPVTAAGQPVGLMLDKSKGLTLGSTIIPNGNFESDTAWGKGAGWSISNGKARFDGTGSYSNLGVVATTSINGKFFKVEFELSDVGTSVTQVRILMSGALAATVPVTGAGKYSAIVVGSSVNSVGIQSQAAIGANYTFSLDNVSLKELAGNHAYQTVSASRPILQQTPILGNELLASGDFSNGLTGWTATGTPTFTASSGRAYYNGVGGSGTGNLVSSDVLAMGKKYMVSYDYEVVQGSFNCGGTHQTVIGGRSITGKGRREFEMLVSDQRDKGVRFGPENAAGLFEFYIDNVSIKEVTGYRTDQNYLKFDGVDDFLQTNNIDFTTTDKVSLFVGQNTNVPSSLGALVETGSNYGNPSGGFGLFAPSGNTVVGSNPSVSGGISGGGGFFNFGGIAANNFTSTLSLKADLSKALKNDQARLRVNGESKVPTTSSTVVAGSKFSNVPVYIGRRGGSQLPFNGHLYSLIGIGRLTTDSETITLEKAIAKNTGVTLNV